MTVRITREQAKAMGVDVEAGQRQTGASLSLALPLPTKRLSPNHSVGSRGQRFAKARETKQYRTRAALEAMATGKRPMWTRAVAQLTFYWPDKRRRDIRNAEHAMKAAYDGLVDAGIITDDSADVLTHLPTRFEVDREQPRVELEIRQIAAEAA